MLNDGYRGNRKNNMQKKLLEIFPLYPIPNVVNLMRGHGLEEWDDTLPLVGKDWVTVSKDTAYMEHHYTFPCWLMPEAYLYYLPSVILYTYRYAEENISIPEVCYHMISVMKDTVLGVDFAKLSATQMQVIEEWFAYVKHIEQMELDSIK